MNRIGKVYLRDKDLRHEQSGDCELLIQVSKKSLSFAVLNTVENLVHVLYHSEFTKSPQEALEDLNIEAGYFSWPFKRVKIAAENFNYTFIPEILFDESNIETYGRIITDSESSTFSVSAIKEVGINTVFEIPENLLAPFVARFPSAQLYTQADPLISGLALSYPEGKRLSIHFNTSTFEAAVLEGKSLVFYNIFEIDTADDFNYFLLLIIQQLGLKRDLPVIMSGFADESGELFNRVRKYFDSISLADTAKMAEFSEEIRNSASHHHFFSLISLHICE